MNFKDDKERGTFISGIYPVVYELDESPIIREIGQAFSDLNMFTVAVWVWLWFYPEVSYGGFASFAVLPEGVLPDLDNEEIELHTVEDIPEELREKFVSLVATDMERFKEDGTLNALAEEARKENAPIKDCFME